jgi:hypothetical protein
MARGFHDADRGRRHGSRTIVIEASTARVDRVRDGCGVRGERGFHDSLTFLGFCLESYRATNSSHTELDEILGLNSVMGQTG